MPLSLPPALVLSLPLPRPRAPPTRPCFVVALLPLLPLHHYYYYHHHHHYYYYCYYYYFHYWKPYSTTTRLTFAREASPS